MVKIKTAEDAKPTSKKMQNYGFQSGLVPEK
jgi:hypothetical protein